MNVRGLYVYWILIAAAYSQFYLVQNSMLNTLSAIGSILSGLAACLGIWVAYAVYSSQKLLSQRQLLIPLWEYMASLRSFDPENPVTPDAIKIANTLELVALCCEGGMIDEKVILRTFKDQFMHHYVEVKKCQRKLPGMSVNGEELLMQNRAAVVFYEKLLSRRLRDDTIN